MKSQTLKYGETEIHLTEFEKTENDKVSFNIEVIGSKEDVEKLKQKIFPKVYTVFEEMEQKISTEKGVKLDSGKNRLGLMLGGFSHALWLVGYVGTFGTNKYTDNGWQEV